MTKLTITKRHLTEDGKFDIELCEEFKTGEIKETDISRIDISKDAKSSFKGFACDSFNKFINLTFLDFQSCKALTDLDSSLLPRSLNGIWLSCSAITELDLTSLPESVDWLNFNRSSIKTLKGALPKESQLKELILSGCKALESLDLSCFSTSLTELNLSLSGIKTLEGALPKESKLEKLDLAICSQLSTPLDSLFFPESIQDLNISGSKITTVKSIFSKGSKLEKLNLAHCKELTSIDLSCFPISLTELSLSGSAITTIEGKLPDGSKLKKLNLEDCKELTSIDLSCFPISLTELSLFGSAITTIEGKLPDGSKLEKLNLSFCKNLELTSKLLTQLQELEVKGCQIHYPSHFMSKGTEMAHFRLNKIIKKHYKDNINQTKYIKELFKRFLSESVEERGGAQEIVAIIIPILNFAENQPSSIEWMNQIASTYLEACVNQPVAGINEISAIVQISQAGNITKKLEMAKRLYVQEAIKNYISTQASAGRGVEVEAGNALFREVYKKLKEEGYIDIDWIGISHHIAYEHAVSSWLDEEKINAAYKEAVKVMKFDIFKVQDMICEGTHFEIWGDIAFPDQFRKRKEELNKEFNAKLELSIAQSMILEDLKTKDTLSDDELSKHAETSDLNEEQYALLKTFYQESQEKYLAAENKSALIEQDLQKNKDDQDNYEPQKQSMLAMFVKEENAKLMPYLTGHLEGEKSFSCLVVDNEAILY